MTQIVGPSQKQSAMQQKKSLSMGVHNNLLMKHKVAGKIRGIGVGVHG